MSKYHFGRTYLKFFSNLPQYEQEEMCIRDRHRARRMEHRIARAVSAGGISGGVAGAVAGSAVAGKRAERKNTASKENRGNTTSSMGQHAGSKVGAVLDTKNKVKDKANAVKDSVS